MTQKESAWPGLLWMFWCALMFVVALGGVPALYERVVIEPMCATACEERGQAFDHLRLASRGGPSAACLCAGGDAILTGAPDAAMFLAVLVFLPGCWAPLWWWGRRSAGADATREARRR